MIIINIKNFVYFELFFFQDKKTEIKLHNRLINCAKHRIKHIKLLLDSFLFFFLQMQLWTRLGHSYYLINGLYLIIYFGYSLNGYLTLEMLNWEWS